MRILIGYNGSDAAKAALHDLRRAGFPDETEAVVLAVAESLLGPKSVSETASIAKKGKTVLCRDFPKWTIKAETASGSPAHEILARAESFCPDVIVIGEPHQILTHGNSIYRHTSQTVLAGAECSVRIARRAETRHSEVRILVGYDGSVGSDLAVETIAARTWPTDTKVLLLAVADSSVLSSIGRFTPQMSDAVIEARFASQWAKTLALGALETLRKAGLSASVEVRLGDTKMDLLEVANRWDVDSIFLGSHGPTSSSQHCPNENVSPTVAARANYTVEIVRKPFGG